MSESVVATTSAALASLGVTDSDLTGRDREQLEAQGFFVVPDYLTPDQVSDLGDEILRLAATAAPRRTDVIEPNGTPQINDLFNKSAAFDCCLARPTLAAAQWLLGEIRVYSLQGRNPAKGEGHQALHSDVTRLGPGDWRLVNTMILLDDVTEDNGATRVVPGSHLLPPLNVPSGNLGGVQRPALGEEEQALLPEDPFATHPREVKLTGRAGTICVINGCIWHGGTLNRSGAPRRVLHMAIGRRDIPSHQDHRATLTPSLWKRSTPAMRYLFDIEGAEPHKEDYC